MQKPRYLWKSIILISSGAKTQLEMEPGNPLLFYNWSVNCILATSDQNLQMTPQRAFQPALWRYWWTGRPGMLRFMGSQRVRHDWATELNWTECIYSDKDPSLRLSLALMQWNLGEQFLPPSPGHLTNSGNSSVVTIQECRGGSTIGNIMGRA